MKKTPLHSLHLDLNARMGEFSGWDMPIQYDGILIEHERTRNQSSLFDICHMGEFEITGENAKTDLEKILTCSVSTLNIGQVRYGYLLSDTGGVLDDLTCYRLGPEKFLLVVNAGTAEDDAIWIQKHLSEDTCFINRSNELAKIDLQGPLSGKVLLDSIKLDINSLNYFRFIELNEMIISRTGYTGELGYEIYMPVNQVKELWKNILKHPECFPAGLGARDTLRLEMGYPLYGHELLSSYSPLIAGDSFIDMSKDFIGKIALEKDSNKSRYKLVGLIFNNKRAARIGDKVYYEDEEIGIVTSGSLAPSLGYAIAIARIFENKAYNNFVDVEIRKRRCQASLVHLPFYKDGTARKVF